MIGEMVFYGICLSMEVILFVSFSHSSAAQKACYRFLANEQTSEEAIVKSMSERCAANVKAKWY